jgi:3-hydroxyacyl-[acyl-carrier-protein] dehydratase
MTGSTPTQALDIEQIRQFLPHRYPMLLVDRVLELEPNVRAVGIKNVSINEPFFDGHFPQLRVMPGVLILEALAQLSGLATYELTEGGTKLGFFGGLNNVRFRRPVTPGDQLRMEIEVRKIKQGVAKIDATATVEGETACKAEITLSFK